MKSLTEWLVIVGGIIISIMTITILQRYYLELEKEIRLRKGLDSFYVLYNTLNRVCDSFIGERRIINLYYPVETLYIYGENRKICYKTEKIETCEELICDTNRFNISIYNSPYIEALEKGAVNFEIIIEKIEASLIKVEYELKI